MVGSEYFSIPTSPLPSPPMSTLNFEADKSQQHQPIPFETTTCSDTGMILTEPGPTWLSCSLQQKDTLSDPWSSHYDHHSRGESHSQQLLATTGSPSSPVLRVEQWDRNLGGQSKFYSFSAPEISYPKCISTDSGSCSSPSPTKTKCPPDETDWDGLDPNMDLPKDIDAEETCAMTPAEIHQQKRKMKRFRLTHQQTRYLMSEFARQSHPDAADRERLAREIPGLSPRQVQVWFQNRRAKLKRLTSDDRERMMLSRALPMHFDTTQTLHPPYPAPQSFACSHSPPVRPVQMDAQEGVSGLANPTILPHASMNTQCSTINFGHGAGDQNFTPPLSVTNTLSPISPTGDSNSPIEGAYYRYHNTRVGSLSSPTSFSVQLHQPRVQIEERIRNAQPQSAACPPRNLPPYVGALGQNDKSILPQRLNEAMIPGIESTGQHDPAASHPLRFSYPRLATYPAIHGLDMQSRSNQSRDLNIHPSDVTTCEPGSDIPPLYQSTSFATPHIT